MTRGAEGEASPGVPAFGVDSVLDRPFDPETGQPSVRPGLHSIEGRRVVWWDPAALALGAEPTHGMRQAELMSKDAPSAVVRADVERHGEWAAARRERLERAGTPDGLKVAVVKGADGREAADIGDEVIRLATAVRERTASIDELRGATFTVSNIGAVGGGFGTPIIPYGTSAILSVGRGADRPVVRSGEVVVAPMFPLSLSYDHRVIDGALGRRFMAALVEAIEQA